MSKFDCLYLYYISNHAFHFLTFYVFKLFCFGNIIQYTCAVSICKLKNGSQLPMLIFLLL